MMLCAIRFGAFYNCFGKDAYILSYLFKYRIKKDNQVAMWLSKRRNGKNYGKTRTTKNQLSYDRYT